MSILSTVSKNITEIQWTRGFIEHGPKAPICGFIGSFEYEGLKWEVKFREVLPAWKLFWIFNIPERPGKLTLKYKGQQVVEFITLEESFKLTGKIYQHLDAEKAKVKSELDNILNGAK